MKKVFETPPTDPEAGLLKEILEKEGIACEIRNQAASSALGFIPPTECYAEVWVLQPEDVARAEQIVANWKSPQQPSEGWTCPKCSERIEGQFVSCWKCGAERPQPALA